MQKGMSSIPVQETKLPYAMQYGQKIKEKKKKKKKTKYLSKYTNNKLSSLLKHFSVENKNFSTVWWYFQC